VAAAAVPAAAVAAAAPAGCGTGAPVVWPLPCAAVAGAPGGFVAPCAAAVCGWPGRGGGVRCGIGVTVRREASATTRDSSSAARSGARPAHSRRRLTSRACAKYSSDSTASPRTEAAPA
jgi:hypothetical protein